jgi:(p)ppGpp synthase/HD superfamily hydrolase
MEFKIEHAKLIAAAAHFGQFDKGGKARLLHVLHVGDQFQDEKHRIVGYLHDTLEDSPLTSYEGLKEIFGDEIATAAVFITRTPTMQYFAYINYCKQNPIARAVKIADIKHNMDRSRWPDMPDSYYEREVKALKILEQDPA